MRPSLCSISAELDALDQIHKDLDWRNNPSALQGIRILILNLVMLDDGWLTDEEDEFVDRIFADVMQHEMRNTR